jgi:hypothetical protein
MRDEWLDLLWSLDGVRQDPKWHPEGDALYHSLQAFDLARLESSDRSLWAAALLHDVGKAVSSPDHDTVGADLLEGLASPRIVWLVRHHLDLLRVPGLTRRRLRGSPSLTDLQRLRRWDVGGRSPSAVVSSPEDALDLLLAGADAPALFAGGEAAPRHDRQEAR